MNPAMIVPLDSIIVVGMTFAVALTLAVGVVAALVAVLARWGW